LTNAKEIHTLSNIHKLLQINEKKKKKKEETLGSQVPFCRNDELRKQFWPQIPWETKQGQLCPEALRP
jgi:hypothetical protein